ncbi:hypothetical protein [Kineococcus glutinatus]
MRTRIPAAGLLLVLAAAGCGAPSYDAASPAVLPAPETPAAREPVPAASDQPSPPSAVLAVDVVAGDRVRLLDGGQPAAGVISYHGTTEEFAPAWRYALPG